LAQLFRRSQKHTRNGKTTEKGLAIRKLLLVSVLKVTLVFTSLNGDLKVFLVAISKFLVAIYKTSTRHDGNRVNETSTSFHPIKISSNTKRETLYMFCFTISIHV
jgi:hypothetical protein